MNNPTLFVSRLSEKAEESELSATVVLPLFWIYVVDETDKPIEGEKYSIHQNGNKDEGILVGGRALFVTINEREPFKFELAGRVCAIKEGAVLLAEELDKSIADGGIEYGGMFFDWGIADGDEADTLFWPKYKDELSYKPRYRPKGPVSIWQHDHITRRSIRIRAKYLDNYTPATIKAIPPQIRVGPMIRYTSSDTAVIWVELGTPGLVRVLYRMKDIGNDEPLKRHGATVRVGGRHYAVIAIDSLSEDTVYEYTLEFAPLPAVGEVIPTEESQFTDDKFPQLPENVLQNIKGQLKKLSFQGNEWLFIRTLRKSYDEHLRFAYGSCRKYNGGGADALEIFGEFLQKNPNEDWPKFLLLIGDQIYADDVGDEQARAIGKDRFGSRVPGPADPDNKICDGAWAGRFAHRIYKNSISKKSLEEIRLKGEKIKKELHCSKLHLEYFPEGYVPQELGKSVSMRTRYMVKNHLLWHIPTTTNKEDIPEVTPLGLKRFKHVLEPTGYGYIPAHHEPAGKNGIHAADFAEFAFLYEMAWARSELVRKVFAHLATFMIFDDHEITDDWNFNKNWVDIIFTEKDPYQYWPKTIADGLAAYWIYQGWGNQSPSKWATDPRTSILMKHRSKGSDALPELRKLIYERAVKPPSSLYWHFKLPISPLFYVMDLRTRRALEKYITADPITHKIHSQDLKLIMPLSDFGILFDELASTPEEVAFIISSVPILLPGAIAPGERVRGLGIGTKDVNLPLYRVKESTLRDYDVEHWVVDDSWYVIQDLLVKLSRSSQSLKTVIALSGDVHFSYNMFGYLNKEKVSRKLNGIRQDSKGRLYPYLLQLVCSAMKNKLSEEDAGIFEAFILDSLTALDVRRRAFHWASGKILSDDKRRSTYSFEGVNLQLGGLAGLGESEMPLLLEENSVAVVDTWFVNKEKMKEVHIREWYLTDVSFSPRDFYYYLKNDKWEMTLS